MKRTRLLVALAAAATLALPAAAHAQTYASFSGEDPTGDVFSAGGGDYPALDLTAYEASRDETTIRVVMTFADLDTQPMYTRYVAALFSQLPGTSDMKGNVLEIRRGSGTVKATLYAARDRGSDSVIRVQTCPGFSGKVVPAKSRVTFILPVACLKSPATGGSKISASAAQWGSKKWRGGDVQALEFEGASRVDYVNQAGSWEWGGGDPMRHGKTSFLGLT